MKPAMSRRSFFLAAILASLTAARPSPAAPEDEGPRRGCSWATCSARPATSTSGSTPTSAMRSSRPTARATSGSRRNVPEPRSDRRGPQGGRQGALSLGGWGWDKQFASIVSEPEAEDRYVKAVMEIVDESDYDGIDLDWEYPDTAEEVVGFERLARRFRKDLDAIGGEEGAADGPDDGRRRPTPARSDGSARSSCWRRWTGST